MASHYCHRHHHHHQTDIPTNSTVSAATCCCSIDFISPQQNSCTPPSLPTDQLLQVIASSLLQSNPNPTHPHTYQPVFQNHEISNHRKYPHKLEKRSLNRQEQQTHSSLASLLRRIEALESSLHHCQRCDPYSLRDAAARVIQTHFRAFLVRRSRTLSQLRDLAHIKSSFNFLKTSISSETHVDFGALFYQAVDLLLKLEFVQSDDPMVKDARRSITRDLVGFLDFLDGVVVKRYEVSVKTVKDTKFSHNPKAKGLGGTRHAGFDSKQRKMLENLRERVERINRLTMLSENAEEAFDLEDTEHIEDFDERTCALGNRKNGVTLAYNGIQGGRNGIRPKVKRSVSFADNGNKLRSIRKEPVPNNGSFAFDGSVGGLVENPHAEAVEEVRGTLRGTEDDEDPILGNEGSSETSDEDKDSKIDMGNEARSGRHTQKPTGKLVFSAPLPVNMEYRADLSGLRL